MLWEEDDRPDDHTRVLYAPGDARSLAPAKVPRDLPQIGHEGFDRAGGYAEGKTLYDQLAVKIVEVPVIDGFAVIETTSPGTLRKMVFERQDDVARAAAREAGVPVDNAGSGRVPAHMIGGPKWETPNPTSGEGAKLLQLDSDRRNGFMFCDAGIVDFWIDPQDLADRRFDRAWGATAGG